MCRSARRVAPVVPTTTSTPVVLGFVVATTPPVPVVTVVANVVAVAIVVFVRAVIVAPFVLGAFVATLTTAVCATTSVAATQMAHGAGGVALVAALVVPVPVFGPA